MVAPISPLGKSVPGPAGHCQRGRRAQGCTHTGGHVCGGLHVWTRSSGVHTQAHPGLVLGACENFCCWESPPCAPSVVSV